MRFWVTEECGDPVVPDAFYTYEQALLRAKREAEEREEAMYVVFEVACAEPVPTEVAVTEYEWEWQ